MKTKLLALVALIMAASCSAPKYAYKFGYYDYQAGKRAAQKEAQVVAVASTNEVVASTEATPVVAEASVAPVVTEKKGATAMTKAEKKAFVKEVKKEIKVAKHQVKKMNAAQSAQSMDNDLKIAAIFGAVGLVGLIIGGNVFYIIGGIALIIGVVFLVKWLMRQ